MATLDEPGSPSARRRGCGERALLHLLALLAAPAAREAAAWDRNTHEAIVQIATETCPPELREVVTRRSRMLVESALAPDGRGSAAAAHGEGGAQELVEILETTRRLQLAGKLAPGQLVGSLGTISHLVADIFAPPDQIALPGSERWLDNHAVLYSHDGPTEVDEPARFVAQCRSLAGLLAPGGSQPSIRFDLACNAVLDAWQIATATPASSWKPDDVQRKLGAAWNSQSLTDTSSEDAAAKTEERRVWADRAEAQRRDAQFREMGAEAALKNARAAAEREPSETASAELASAKSAHEAAVAARIEADALLQRVLKGDVPKAPRPELVVVEQSVAATTLEGALVVLVENGSAAPWSGLRAHVSGTDGPRGSLDLRSASPHAPGRIRRYVGRFVTWGEPSGLTFRYAPEPGDHAATPPPSGARATAEAALRGRPAMAAGAATPLAGTPGAIEPAGEWPAAERRASRLHEIVALYDTAGQSLRTRFEKDPAAARERKVATELLDLAASLRADAGSAPAGIAGVTLALRVASGGAGHAWELDLAGSDAAGWQVQRAVVDWEATRKSLETWLSATIAEATRGGSSADLDLRHRFAAEGILGYGEPTATQAPSSPAAPPPASR